MSTEKKFKIRIIIPVNTTAFTDEVINCVQEIIPPDVYFDVKPIEGGIPHIQNRTDFTINSPYVIKLAQQTEAEGFDGIFVTDFDYCGVEATRENVNIPVIGGFRPQAFTAMALSEKIGLVTIVDSIVAMQEEHFRYFGMLPNLACILPIDTPVADLPKKDIVIPKVFDKAVEAVEKHGAESIILGCTGFIGIAKPVAKMLKEQKGWDIPVTDPNHMAVTYLIALVRNGLMQSRLAYYQNPSSQ